MGKEECFYPCKLLIWENRTYIATLGDKYCKSDAYNGIYAFGNDGKLLWRFR